MPLNHVIAHHLHHVPEGDAQPTLRQAEMVADERSEALLDLLKGSFLGRISREHGSFAEAGETEALLPRLLQEYLGDRCDFLDLSTQLAEGLQQGLKARNIALDDHALLFEERGPDQHLLYLFVAGRREALTLDEQLVLTPCYTLDSGPSLFGLKVDIAAWQSRRQYAYLSLLPPRGAPALNELFREVTGFANGTDKQEATLSFLQGVEAYSKQLPEEKVNDYRSQVVEYCIEQEQQDAPVDVRELSLALDDIDRNAFVQALEQHQGEEEPPFRVDKRSLQRYIKFAGREKDLAISFSAYQLDERIRYDADNDTLSIRGIPKALRNQLLGHLKSE